MARVLRLACVIVVAAMMAVVSVDAYAAGPMGRNLGLGVSLGNPTSITGKYHLDAKSAIDFHIGTPQGYYQTYYRNSLFLGADYLMQVWSFVENSTLRMPFYAGLGGMLMFQVGDSRLRCDRFGRNCYDPYDFGIAARVPVGTAIEFQSAPFEIYLEMAPALTLLFSEYYGGSRLHFTILNLALGARFYFE